MQSQSKINLFELLEQNNAAEKIDQCLLSLSEQDKTKLINELDVTYKRTALALACSLGAEDVVDVLLRHGADVSIGGLRMRRSVLDYARGKSSIQNKILPLVKAFVDKCLPKENQNSNIAAEKIIQSVSKLTDAEKAKIALLAYSLADFYGENDDKKNADYYFNIASSLTKVLTTNDSICAALYWRLFSYYFPNQFTLAQDALQIAIARYNKASKADKTSILFETEASVDTLFEYLKLKTLDEKLFPMMRDQVSSRLYKFFECDQITWGEKFTRLFQHINQNINTLNISIISMIFNEVPKFYVKNAVTMQALPDNFDKVSFILGEQFSILGPHLRNMSIFDCAIVVLDNANKFLRNILQKNAYKTAESLKAENSRSITVMSAYLDFDAKSYELMKTFSFNKRDKFGNPVKLEKASQEEYKIFIKFLRDNFIQHAHDFAELPRSDYAINSISWFTAGYIDMTCKKNTVESIRVDQIKLDQHFTTVRLEELSANIELFVMFLKATRKSNDITVFMGDLQSLISVIKIPSNTSELKSFRHAYFAIIKSLFAVELLYLQNTTDPTKHLLQAFQFLNNFYYKFDPSKLTSNTMSLLNFDEEMLRVASYYEKAYRVAFPQFIIGPGMLVTIASTALKYKQYDLANQYALEALDILLEDSSMKAETIEKIGSAIHTLSYSEKPIFAKLDAHELGRLDVLLERNTACIKRIKQISLIKLIQAEILDSFGNFWFKQTKFVEMAKLYDFALKYNLFILNNVIPNMKNPEAFLLKVIPKIVDLSVTLLRQISSSQMDAISMPINAKINLMLNALSALAKQEKEFNLLISSVSSMLGEVKELPQIQVSIICRSINKIIADNPLIIDKGIHHQFRFSCLSQLSRFDNLSEKDFNDILLLIEGCQKYYFRYTNLPKGYEVLIKNKDIKLPSSYYDVMINIHIKVAAWYKKNSQYLKLLEINNTIRELCIASKDSNYQAVLTNSLSQSNEILFLLAEQSAELNPLKAINYYNDIVDNCKLNHDDLTKLRSLKALSIVLSKHVEKLMNQTKFQKASLICKQMILQLSDANNESLDEITKDFAAKMVLAEDSQGKAEKFASMSHSTMFTLTSTKQQKAKKPKKPKEETAVEEKPVAKKMEPAAIIPSSKPEYEGGIVGCKVEAKFIKKGMSNLYPVVMSNIPGFCTEASDKNNTLEKTNILLFSLLKKAALEGGICREYGESGIKYLGHSMWEAKVSGTSRLFGQTVKREDGTSFIVFDTYLPRGLHVG